MRGLIIVADPVAPELAAGLPGWEVREVFDPGALPAALAQAHALVVRSRTRVTAELLAGAPNLRVIGRAGAGLDGINLRAAQARGLAVVAAGEAAASAVAELTLGLLIAGVRDLPGAARAARTGDWSKRITPGLAGRTLGVVGLGRVGSRVAAAAQALGMQVLATSRTQANPDSLPLAELLAAADVLTLHLPLTPATRGLINAQALARLPRGAFLVNTARGALVDGHALRAAIDSGHLSGAALDVLDPEPPPADHPLLDHPRILVTPHLGASTVSAQRAIAIELAAALRKALAT